MERFGMGRIFGIAVLAAMVASAACGDAFGVANQPAADTDASAGSGGAAGQTTECTAAGDCNGQDSECSHRTCTSGKCGFKTETAGTPLQQQTKGDCVKRVCDGSGGIKEAFDDTDVFDDGNLCTIDKCTSGKPSHDPAASGTPCGTPPMECDSQGKCVGCTKASDCGTDLPCSRWQCTSGACGQQMLPTGTVLPDTQTGNCHHDECNSMGAVVAVVDNTDKPASDGNVCTKDTCENGAPFPAEPDGMSCGVCLMCQAAHCGNCPSSTHYCANPSQACVPRKDAGETCANATDCLSGNCRNHVCCLQACDKQCQECSASGKGCQKMGVDDTCQDSSKGCYAEGTCNCANGIRDGGETDVDCGGPCAPIKKCTLGMRCGPYGGSNCTTGVCCPCGGEDTCKPTNFDCSSC